MKKRTHRKIHPQTNRAKYADFESKSMPDPRLPLARQRSEGGLGKPNLFGASGAKAGSVNQTCLAPTERQAGLHY